MNVLKFRTHGGQEFYCKAVEPTHRDARSDQIAEVVEANCEKDKICRVELLNLTEEEYRAIPVTSDSHAFWSSQA